MRSSRDAATRHGRPRAVRAALRILPGVLLLAWLHAFGGVGTASAQEPVERLWSECALDVPGLPPLCADAALALQALHAGMGALLAAGGPLPVGPSTLGHRTEGSPRVVVDLGGTWSSFRHPDLSVAPAAGGGGETRSRPVAARLTGIVGVFPGFSPLPTMGGVLSLDGVVTLHAAGVPDSPASPGTRFGWGAGLRLGVFRESFSLPGVTISAMHHRMGEVRYGIVEGPGASATLEPAVTSVRVTAGKELWPIGVAGGIGWDRYRGEGRIRATTGAGAPTGTAGPRSLESDRRYLFAGVSYTWIVTQLAAELVWAPEPSPTVEFEGTRGFEAGGTELQAALSFRIRY